MITKQEISFSNFAQAKKLARLNLLSRFIVNATRFLKLNQVAYKLDYFERMLNFMRLIGLYILSNNKSFEFKSKSLTKSNAENNKGRIGQSLLEFLFHFEIIEYKQNQFVIKENYKRLLEQDIPKITIKSNDDLKNTSFYRKKKNLVNDFLFVKDIIRKYRDPQYALQHINKKRHVWESLIAEKKLDYEIRLSETLLNLTKLNIPHKIVSPFDEDYYTESGRNAFRNFTQFRFLEYFNKITTNKENIRVFDLGCGYGNYLEILNDNFSDISITGIEKNPKVYSSTLKKFENSKNVTVINDDFFKYTPDEKYDVILMNYVLFYFNSEEKKKVLEKAKNTIHNTGSIVLCQYFSGIEHLKKELAQKQKDYSAPKKIEMYYSDKILYANTLWNDAVDTFSEAVKWEEFKTIISELNLQINSMTNADKFYYSLFIELKKG